jgi:serine/threonine-protein kinase HipA
MDREALVYVDLDGVPHLMRRLWARRRKNKESATFEYDKTWLENPARFFLEPALHVGPGPFHTPADTPMFGAIGDSPPDLWGGRSCAAWNAGARSAKAGLRARSRKSTPCCW